MSFPLSQSARENWSSETGSGVPSRVSPLTLQTQGESGTVCRAKSLPLHLKEGNTRYLISYVKLL